MMHTAIARALTAMGERSRFTDAQLAKKVRKLYKIEGKKKAVLALADILAAMESLDTPYAITVTNANDLVIERRDEPVDTVVSFEAKQRRQRHEKSQVLFTNGDIAQSGNARAGSTRKRHGIQGRTERVSLNVNRDYADE